MITIDRSLRTHNRIILPIVFVMGLLLGGALFAGCGLNTQPAPKDTTPQPSLTVTPASSSSQANGEPGVGAAGGQIKPADRPAEPLLTLASSSITQTGELKLTASGFQPGEPVQIGAKAAVDGSVSPLLTAEADAQGALPETTINLPEWLTSGPQRLTAVGQISQRQAEADLYVRAEKLWVEVGNYAVKHLDKLGFIAGGFEPGETLKVFFQNSPNNVLGSAQTDQAGNTVWTEVMMPLVEPGEHTLIIQGEKSGLQVARSLTVMAFAPQFDLDPYAGLPGTNVILYGQGFYPGETVDVFLAGASEPALTLTANEGGGFEREGPINVPANARSGSMDVVMIGETSKAKVTRGFTVVAPYPFGGLSSFSGFPGSIVQFDGLGFAAGEEVNIYLGGRQGTLVATATTDKEGRFVGAGPAQVPADATSDVSFTFVGQSSGVETSTPFRVIIIPAMETGRGQSAE